MVAPLTAAGGVLIAAATSGTGKTTIATGIMAALTGQGRTVAGFKVGPDFIDPTFHALATGSPSRNLDTNLVGDHMIGPIYAAGSHNADIAIIEGVMGLFDGRIPSGAGSSADIAALTGTPVILVVDGTGQSHSIGALVHGFSTFDTRISIGGVVLNRVGSPRHEKVLTDSVNAVGIDVLGCIPRSDELVLPSRHLGLVTPADNSAASDTIAAMGRHVTERIDIAAISAMARTHVTAQPWQPPQPHPHATGRTIAIASGPAFGFEYPELAEIITSYGFTLHRFDPRHDPLPSHTCGLILPGGYPEEHATELAAAHTTRDTITTAITAGLPVYAECGGYTYLCSHINDNSMLAATDGHVTYPSGLTLGYRDAVALTDSFLFDAGHRICGHEFHRTTVTHPTGVQHAFAWSGSANQPVTDGFTTPNIHASYLHIHPLGAENMWHRYITAALNYANR